LDFNILDAITKRTSIRSFSMDPIPRETKQKLQNFMDGQKIGPFGSNVRFSLEDLSHLSPLESKVYGSFSLIRSTGYFIVGAVYSKEYNLEDYGYVLEKIILYATQLGLGSCWLGAFFNRTAFGQRIQQQESEIIPAIVMIGNPNQNRSLMEKSVRLLVKAEKRKPFSSLFFQGDFATPINCSGKNKYLLALEMVRKAPSSINRQPWRIVKDLHSKKFHFYLQHSFREISSPETINMQRIDMGIAMAHFFESMAQLDYTGTWSINDPDIRLPNKQTQYITTWTS